MPVNKSILFKYGGNAMTSQALKRQVLYNISSLTEQGYQITIVHGGGPFIKKTLADANIVSEFVDGLRKTTPQAMEYVEMALKGKVNGSLVSLINSFGFKAVGLSGKDGQTVIAKKHLHQRNENGEITTIDLGQVGDVETVDPTLIRLLLDKKYIPIITCIASDKNGNDYNVNADMFAGHIAAALKVDQYIILTDVDGLLMEKNDASTIIKKLELKSIDALKEKGVIQGGMIPKIESCVVAIQKGAKQARIINGTDPDQITSLFVDSTTGTLITA